MKTILCFEKHANDRAVWSIRYGGHWLGPFVTVRVDVPMLTDYHPTRNQPKAYLFTDMPVQVLVSASHASIVAK